MANLNKVMLIGRLTREPESRDFAGGGKVAWFGFAVNNQVKNHTTGQWEEKPVFLDVKAFNRETGRKLADVVLQYLHKGHQAYLEGHLVMEEWVEEGTGKKRTALKLVLENLQFLEPKAADGGSPRSSSAPTSARSPAPASSPSRSSGGGEYEESDMPPSGGGNQDEEIPF
jgi:single-strand DNA-binding protein